MICLFIFKYVLQIEGETMVKKITNVFASPGLDWFFKNVYSKFES